MANKIKTETLSGKIKIAPDKPTKKVVVEERHEVEILLCPTRREV
jgi:hypothetical protein